MAKTATLGDTGLMPSSGKWIWKEETQSLEFLSNNPNADRNDRRRGRQQKGGVHFQDANSKRQDRGATPSLGSRAYGVGRGRQSRGVPGHRSPRQTGKGSTSHTHVTLDDVKGVAIGMLSEVEVVSPSFEEIYTTEQFDEFLMWLLNFFHSYFEKRAHEQKPNPMNIEPSVREKQYYADLCAKQDIALKKMGQSYCVLVLGIGMDHHHHMACGFSRVSSTYKDRSMYETLYSFCAFVVWITFKRKEYDTIKKELGRLLRSDTFNPAIRVKNAPDPDPVEDENKEGDKKEKKTEKKLTPAEYRRLHGKRPAIKSIINQRSPALVSILPSPKEESHWLFKRAEEGSTPCVEDAEAEVLPHKLSKFKIGIIGEPLNLFNALTLSPIGAENDDEEQEGEDKGQRRDSVINGTSHGKSPPTDGVARQVTAISAVTTDALSDED